MEKERYTPPTVTDLGDAIKQTKGAPSGDCVEAWGYTNGPPPRIEPDEE